MSGLVERVRYRADKRLGKIIRIVQTHGRRVYNTPSRRAKSVDSHGNPDRRSGFDSHDLPCVYTTKRDLYEQVKVTSFNDHDICSKLISSNSTFLSDGWSGPQLVKCIQSEPHERPPTCNMNSPEWNRRSSATD